MDGLKKVPFKNYIILSFTIICSIALILYLYLWFGAYEKGKYNSSIVTEKLNVIHYNELYDYLTENKDAIIYISLFNNKDIYNFEKKFNRFINKNTFNGDILYLNVTDELNNDKLYKDIKSNYCSDFPCIVIFENGNVKSSFSIKNGNYDLSLIEEYLIDEGVLND